MLENGVVSHWESIRFLSTSIKESLSKNDSENQHVGLEPLLLNNH